MSIRLEKLSRSFGKYLVFQTDIIETPEKGLVLLMGPNGSGKTTLLRILATLTLPTSGDAKIFGLSVKENRPMVRTKIGFMPNQEGGFFPRLTGRENLFLFGKLRGFSEQDIDRAIQKYETFFIFKEILNTQYMFCSTGMKQKLLFCRVLLSDAPVLILDEPTRNLDIQGTEKLLSVLKELATKKLILFSSHREELWPEINQKLEIKEGKIIVY